MENRNDEPLVDVVVGCTKTWLLMHRMCGATSGEAFCPVAKTFLNLELVFDPDTRIAFLSTRLWWSDPDTGISFPSTRLWWPDPDTGIAFPSTRLWWSE
jgi:hypothetical protein